MTKFCLTLLIFVGLISCSAVRKGAVSPQDSVGINSVSKREIAIDKKLPPALLSSYLYTDGIRNMISGGDPKHSIAAFEAVIKQDSTHAPSYFELATITADPNQALKYSLKANQLDTTNLWYKAQLGRLYITTKEYDAAMNIYSKLVELAPNNPDNYRLLAALYEQSNQPFTAISVLDEAESKFGVIEELSAFKRELLMSVKLYDKAISEAKSIVNNFPYDETHMVALAEIYAAARKDSLALEAFDRALTINPSNIETTIALNDYYKQLNDYPNFLNTAKKLFNSDDIPLETKIKFFNDIIKTPFFYKEYFFQVNDLASTLAVKYPDDFSAIKTYATHLISIGEAEQGLALYKAQIKDKGNELELFTTILDIEAYLNRADSVEKYSQIALREFPKNSDLYMRRAGVLGYFIKDYKAASKDFHLALKYAQTDSLKSIIYGSLGDNAHQMNKMELCFKYYDQSLKYNPNYANVLNNYSYFLSEKDERLNDALRMSETANKLTPNNPTYMDTQAWVLYKLGRYEEAKTLMRSAVSLDRDASAELFIHYGDILAALGDTFMAEVYWRKALDKGYDKIQIENRLKKLAK